MKDGLYMVKTKYLCAGFVLLDGFLIDCAPVLKRNISYWMTKAVWICK